VERPNRSLFFPILAVSVHALLLMCSVYALMVFEPRAERAFRDFNLKQDTATQIAVGVGRWLYNYWYCLAIVVGPGFLMEGLIMYVLYNSRRGRAWSYVWAWAGVLLIVLSFSCLGMVLLESCMKLLEPVRE
jgi:type II secretory pathway component PulF